MKKIKGKLEINPSGSGYLILESGDKVYVYKKNTGEGLDQDIVEAKIIDGKIEGTIEAKVTSVIKRNKTQFTGILQKVGDYGFLIPDSKRLPDFYIRKEQASKYKIGEKLLIEMGTWKKGKNPTCKIIKSLGMVGENDAEMDSILYTYGLRPDFPEKVEKESEEIDWNISDEEIKKRKDFRKVTTITIDPDTAKDFDDAISIQKLDNNLYEIGIHIADVSHYVKKGSEMDKEALRRGNSVYLVDRVIPMIPERLSNGVCSLRPNEDKLTYSVVFKMDLNGKVKDLWIGRTVIHSDRRFTYGEVQDIIENNLDDLYKDEVNILNTISQNIRRSRKSLLFNRTEVKFEMDRDFKPNGIRKEENNESHQLIEELMLMANKVIGELLHKNGIGIYRNHDKPDVEKLMELKNVAKTCGFDLHLDDVRKGLNQLNKEVKDTPYENMIQNLTIRCMAKADYGINSIGHYGLGFEFYSHATSPIRRYSDICVWRLIENFI